MTIGLQWRDRNKRALVYTFPAVWTWDDFLAVKLQADGWLTYLEDHDDPVALIFDMRASGPIPTNAFTVSRRVFGTAHLRGTPIIGVTDNRTIVGLVDLLRRFLSPQKMRTLRMVRTMEDAMALIDGHGRRAA